MIKFKNLLKISVWTYFLTYLIYSFIRRFTYFSHTTFDPDWYIKYFEQYLINGHYKSVSEGTSVLFYFVLGCFLDLDSDLYKGFWVFNTICQILIACIGVKIIYSLNKDRDDKFIKLVAALSFALFWLSNRMHQYNHNDLFFTLVLTLLYFFLTTYKKNTIIFVSLFFALLLSTRLLSILFLPSIIVLLIFQKKNISLNNYFKGILVFVLILFSLHFPSIIENQKLSFYDKNELKKEIQGVTWEEVNFFSTLLNFQNNINSKNLKANYWKKWSSNELEELKKQNQIKKVPKYFWDYVLHFPRLYAYLLVINLKIILSYYFKKYSLFIILPLVTFLISWNKKKKIILSDYKFFMTTLVTLCVFLTVLTTTLEMRWLVSFELLIIIGIVESLILFRKQSKLFFRVYLFVTLSSLSFFNFYSIVNLLTQ